jgi:cytochrome b
LVSAASIAGEMSGDTGFFADTEKPDFITKEHTKKYLRQLHEIAAKGIFIDIEPYA